MHWLLKENGFLHNFLYYLFDNYLNWFVNIYYFLRNDLLRHYLLYYSVHVYGFLNFPFNKYRFLDDFRLVLLQLFLQSVDLLSCLLHLFPHFLHCLYYVVAILWLLLRLNNLLLQNSQNSQKLSIHVDY